MSDPDLTEQDASDNSLRFDWTGPFLIMGEPVLNSRFGRLSTEMRRYQQPLWINKIRPADKTLCGNHGRTDFSQGSHRGIDLIQLAWITKSGKAVEQRDETEKSVPDVLSMDQKTKKTVILHKTNVRESLFSCEI